MVSPNDDGGNISAVPEPSSVACFLTSLLTLGVVYRMRQRKPTRQLRGPLHCGMQI